MSSGDARLGLPEEARRSQTSRRADLPSRPIFTILLTATKERPPRDRGPSSRIIRLPTIPLLPMQSPLSKPDQRSTSTPAGRGECGLHTDRMPKTLGGQFRGFRLFFWLGTFILVSLWVFSFARLTSVAWTIDSMVYGASVGHGFIRVDWLPAHPVLDPTSYRGVANRMSDSIAWSDLFPRVDYEPNRGALAGFVAIPSYWLLLIWLGLHTGIKACRTVRWKAEPIQDGETSQPSC